MSDTESEAADKSTEDADEAASAAAPAEPSQEVGKRATGFGRMTMGWFASDAEKQEMEAAYGEGSAPSMWVIFIIILVAIALLTGLGYLIFG